MKRNNTNAVFDRVILEQIDDDIDVESGDPVADTADSSYHGRPIEDLDETPQNDAKSTPTDERVSESALDEGAASEAADDDEHVDEGASRRTRRRRIIRRVLIVSASLAFVGALGLSVFMGWQLKQRDAVSAASRTALDTAKAYAVTLSSIDIKDVDKNFDEVLNGATGEFKDMYSQSSAQLRQLLIDNKAVSHGVVLQAGITSAAATKVDVILFVDQSISNAVTVDPRLDRLRMVMTMELVDGRWLASHVEVS